MNIETQTDPASSTVAGKYLTFRLGKESYGVAILRVREIIRMQSITAVPRMPSYVQGVINLRGLVIPIVDLRLKFNLSSHENTESTCVIVVNIRLKDGEEKLVGLIVDAVEEVINITPSEIENTPDFGTQLSLEYICGMAQVKGTVKTLLDIEKVINDAALAQMAAVG